jgi:flavin-binding protein dodecin
MHGIGDGSWAQGRLNHSHILQEDSAMSVAKVTEITAASPKSFEDAVVVGLKRAEKTLNGIQGAWIKEQKVEWGSGKIAEYRVTMEVTFILED